MKSAERVFAALRLEEPDRVPVIEGVIDERIRRALFPNAWEIGAFCEAVGLDAVASGLDFRRRDETDDTYVDEWGVLYGKSQEAMGHPLVGPVHDRDDLLHWEPPDPEAEWRLGALPDLIARYKGNKAITLHYRAAFMYSACVAGLDNLLMQFALDPEFAHELMDKVVDANIAMIRRAIRAGADIVVLGDDYAHNFAPMMSPEHFREFIYPRLRKTIAAVHEEGAYCIKHSDGNLWPILDMIVDAGPDAINPLEPVAGMDIARVKAEYGERACLIGNIDCGELLSHGTVAQVEEAVRQCIIDAGQGGGYILSSSNSIHSSVNPRNFRAMVRRLPAES